MPGTAGVRRICLARWAILKEGEGDSLEFVTMCAYNYDNEYHYHSYDDFPDL